MSSSVQDAIDGLLPVAATGRHARSGCNDRRDCTCHLVEAPQSHIELLECGNPRFCNGQFWGRQNENRNISEEAVPVRLHHALSPIGELELKGPDCRSERTAHSGLRPGVEGHFPRNRHEIRDAESVHRDFARHDPVELGAPAVQPRVLAVVGFYEDVSEPLSSSFAVVQRGPRFSRGTASMQVPM